MEDADKFSLILFAPYGTELDIALVSALASTFQDNYPERLHRLYALPTGILTRVMWEGVRPFLSAGTAAKVVLTSGGHRPREIEAPLTIETLREALCGLGRARHARAPRFAPLTASRALDSLALAPTSLRRGAVPVPSGRVG